MIRSNERKILASLARHMQAKLQPKLIQRDPENTLIQGRFARIPLQMLMNAYKAVKLSGRSLRRPPFAGFIGGG
ncbi:hypothetical protein ACNHKD_12585 [Methylocystis sp. JAN1]|uniref:hypothetical protein n=1 Tax=Methylocystis sp. JAN1 TaxID=3397211 RepID=UPI003FA23A43